jgi:hypothetical protein
VAAATGLPSYLIQGSPPEVFTGAGASSRDFRTGSPQTRESVKKGGRGGGTLKRGPPYHFSRCSPGLGGGGPRVCCEKKYTHCTGQKELRIKEVRFTMPSCYLSVLLLLPSCPSALTRPSLNKQTPQPKARRRGCAGNH